MKLKLDKIIRPKDFLRILRKGWFPIILVMGLAAYLTIRYIEDRPYHGRISTITAIVTKVTFVSGGTVTGRSFVRIMLDDNRSYRMPLDEIVLIKKGDQVVLAVRSDDIEEGSQEIRVLDYCIENSDEACRDVK